MATMNKVILMGNLTKDPDQLRTTPSGVSVLDLRLAVNRKFKGGDGELRDETCFVNVSAWGKEAESCSKYLAKGSQILVEGRLKYDEWEKNGQKQSRISVVAERVQFLGAPKQRTESAPESAGADNPPVKREQVPDTAGQGDSDDLPF